MNKKQAMKHLHQVITWPETWRAWIRVPKSTLLGMLWVCSVGVMGDAMAGPSDCYAIKDADTRAYCLAETKRDYGYCYRVKNTDRRNGCLAAIQGQRGHCHAIKEPDSRKACLARVR